MHDDGWIRKEIIATISKSFTFLMIIININNAKTLRIIMIIFPLKKCTTKKCIVRVEQSFTTTTVCMRLTIYWTNNDARWGWYGLFVEYIKQTVRTRQNDWFKIIHKKLSTSTFGYTNMTIVTNKKNQIHDRLWKKRREERKNCWIAYR